MLGRSNLSLRALVPRMVTIGVILAFATSWIAFRSVVWNLFVATPDYLATLRSEEHTSELQSLMRISYAVFCLKKKNKQLKPTLVHNHNSISYINTAQTTRLCTIT